MATIGTKRQIRRIWCCRSTFLTPFNIFLCFIYIYITCSDGFSYDNNSANDEQQPQILSGDQFSLADRSSRRKLLFRSQRVKKNCGNHPVRNITLEFFMQGVTYLLKNESYMYSTDRRE
jgi:hypothetical protein